MKTAASPLSSCKRAWVSYHKLLAPVLPALRPCTPQAHLAGRCTRPHTRRAAARRPSYSSLASVDMISHKEAQHASNVASMAGIAQFLGIAGLSVCAAYTLHPTLLNLVTELWDFKQDGDSSFETSFFGLVGIIYGLMGGNTFLFLYERQVNIVQELYGETFALELLLQQTFLAVQDKEPRNEMAAFVRRYIEEELFDPIEMTSPFDPQSSFIRLVDVVVQEQQAGCEVGGIVEAVQKLADAQSRRSAVAAQVLPGMHWIFLNALLFIFVVCFLVFDAAGDSAVDINPERRLAFGALVGVLTLTQQVLYDLNDPISGLYTFRQSLEARLSYVYQLLDQLEQGSPGWVPAELRQLQQLGLVGSFTSSETQPSVPHPARKGRKGRAKEQSYVGGPLHFMSSHSHGHDLDTHLEAQRDRILDEQEGPGHEDSDEEPEPGSRKQRGRAASRAVKVKQRANGNGVSNGHAGSSDDN